MRKNGSKSGFIAYFCVAILIAALFTAINLQSAQAGYVRWVDDASNPVYDPARYGEGLLSVRHLRRLGFLQPRGLLLLQDVVWGYRSHAMGMGGLFQRRDHLGQPRGRIGNSRPRLPRQAGLRGGRLWEAAPTITRYGTGTPTPNLYSINAHAHGRLGRRGELGKRRSGDAGCHPAPGGHADPDGGVELRHLRPGARALQPGRGQHRRRPLQLLLHHVLRRHYRRGK